VTPQHRTLLVALGACGLAALLWTWFGEPWEVLADGFNYLEIYRGAPAYTPFGYRVAAPWLARLLPLPVIQSFAVITLGSLILTGGVLAVLGRTLLRTRAEVGILVLLWASSFAFAYYATTLVRTDAPMLLMLAGSVWLARRRVPAPLLGCWIGASAPFHELGLFALPMLWLDRLFRSGSSGGDRYSVRALFLVSLIAVTVAFAPRFWVVVRPSDLPSYTSSDLGTLLAYVRDYTGGPLKLALRIYASFGPALLYALAWVLLRERIPEALAFLGAMALAVLATLVATDTLRVMAIVFLPVFVAAARWIGELYRSGSLPLGLLLLGLQLGYSVLVYGHLRTFESSRTMTLVAMLLSALAGLALLYSARGTAFGARWAEVREWARYSQRSRSARS
jgi:hypothetical protein